MRLFVLSGIALVFLVGGGWLYATHYYAAPGPLESEKTVVIDPGTGFKDIVRLLGSEGVIDQPLVFSAITIAQGNQYKLKAGEYSFAAAMTPGHVSNKLLKGEVVIHALTIPEGLVTEDIVNALQSDPYLQGPVPENIGEGELLPETYFFTRGESCARIVSQMRENMKQTLEALWASRQEGLPLKTMREAVILASIVEKETGQVSERARIAGVFINRLRQRMMLQSDPTTLYGMYRATGKRGNTLTRKNLSTPTPFNTYTIGGLPPGPICHPGKAAMEAVLHPAQTHDLYFVADGTGSHRFAATLKEHNRNVDHYRDRLKTQE